MAGARVIKLSFWTDGEILKLPIPGRLIYQAVWAWCDDQGIGPANIDDFHVRMFPRDIDLDVAGYIELLIKAKRIVEFEDEDGDRFWWVPTFHKHQRIDQITPQYPKPPRDLVVSTLGEKRAEQWFETIRGKDRKEKRKSWQRTSAASQPEAGPLPADNRPPQRTENGELRTENCELPAPPTPSPDEDDPAPASAALTPEDPVLRKAEQFLGGLLGDADRRRIVTARKVNGVPDDLILAAFDNPNAVEKRSVPYALKIAERMHTEGISPQRTRAGPPPKPERPEPNWLYGGPEEADRMLLEEYGNDRFSPGVPPRASPAA